MPHAPDPMFDGSLRQEPATKQNALFIDCSVRDSVIIGKLVGPSVGTRESPIISAAIAAECEKIAAQSMKPRAVVLDFKDVNFMNSTGLGMCVEVRNRIHKLGGKLVLYRMSDQLVAVMKMTKMDRLYTIVNDPAKLEKALRK